MSNYREQLAELRQQQAEERRDEIIREIVEIEEEHKAAEQRAVDALRHGDEHTARWQVDAQESLEAQLREAHARLDSYDRAQGPAPLSEDKQRWIDRRKDLAALPGMEKVATRAHNQIVSMGVAEDSPQYFELMGHALEPAGYQESWGPDDVAAACGLSPSEYNREVRKLWQAKQSGQYPDKQ